MPVRGKRSIADTYVSILPETSRVASEIAKSFREVDTQARQAGRRWRDEMTRELSDVRVLLNVDAAQARADAERLKAQIERMRPTMNVDIDHDRLGASINSAFISGLARMPSQVASQATGAGQALGGAVQSGIGSAISGGGDITSAIKAVLIASAVPVIAQLGGVASAAAGSLGLIPAALGGIAAGIGTVMIATQGFSDALDSIRDPEKFATALASLAPNAQQAALAIQALLPAWDQLKNATSDALFANGAQMINQLGAAYLPAIQGLTTQVAGAINAGLSGIFDTLMRPDVQASLQTTFNNIGTAFQIAAQAAAPFTTAFTQIIQVGSQFLPGISTAIVEIANRFSAFITQAAADGSLQRWIQTGISALGQLGGLVLSVVQDFGRLAPIGAEYLPKIVNAIEGISHALVAAMPLIAALGPNWDLIATAANGAAATFEWISNLLNGTIIPVVRAVGIVFGEAWDVISNKVSTVWNAVQPILKLMADALVAVTGPLGTVLNLASKLPGLGDINKPVTGTAVAANPPSLDAANRFAAADQAAGKGLPPSFGLGTAALDMPGAYRRRDGSIGFAPLPQSSIVSPVPSGGYAVPAPPPPKGSGSGSSSPAAAAGLYGLPAGTAISAGGAGFPDWVYQVADAFGLKASTYAGHQETNRNEAGFMGNPNDLNRGIDWTGPVENMQRFAEYLATIPGSLEQLIFRNPNTGQEFGVAGGRAVGHDYYAADFAGHQNHVHTRQANAIPLPGMVPGYDASLGAPALAGVSGDSRLRDAQQRVQDRTDAVTRAQMRLDELNAKGTATALQRKTAEDALAKAQRERADAVEDLAKAQQKLTESNGKGGSGDFGQLGQDLLGGMLQVFGFDGSLFADPSQFGITKLLSGLVNWGTQPAAGSGAGGLPGGGGGSLLSAFVPQAFGALRLGAQDDGPVPFMGGMPGGSGQGSAMAAGAQFAASSIHGAAAQMGATPGPGNGNHYGDVININGGGEPTQMADTFREQVTIPRARQAVR
ncbi:tape measure protein [Mycobacterium Phage Nergal]|nr:tape measure protein [Mycobacterium Phage Nergal]